MGASGDRPTATATASKRAQDHRADDAGEGVAQRRGRVGPERPKGALLLGAAAHLAADDLPGDEQSGQGGDPSEHTQRKGFGLDGPLGLGSDGRSHVEGNGGVRKRPDELGLHAAAPPGCRRRGRVRFPQNRRSTTRVVW